MIRYKILNSKKIKSALVACLCVLLAVSLLPLSVQAQETSAVFSEPSYERESYRRALIERGFPLDYADKLSEVWLAHPTWHFEPLFISEMDGRYTFDYIIRRETEDPETNLVYPSEEYADFRDGSSAVYDSGWYSASDDAVRYFIDPRNFLSERDIFQFEDVSYYDRDYSGGVDGVLGGTFMQSLTLENGVSMRDYILQVGKELSVSPVHIAARIRQEQGVENSSGMISGKCGDLLYYFYANGIQYTADGKLVATPSGTHTRQELLSYNGFYNFFNLGASGRGLFEIYLSAMKRAKSGTPELAGEWGGASWDAMYKSVKGGVYSLKTRYIDDYQNTMYLQKFNVDPRSSRNFWGQYMQNVGAALSEGRSTYDSYKIPVYSNMPASPSPDPSRGESNYSTSDGYISYRIRSDFPSAQNTQDKETRVAADVERGEELRIQGWSVHTYGTEYYELSIDGGEFVRITSYPRADVREEWADSYPLSYDVNGYLCYLDTASLSVGTHRAVVRARTVYGSYYEVSYIEFDVASSETSSVGDVNRDGIVDGSDVWMLLRYLSGYDAEIGPEADVTGDGVINNRDLLALIRIVKEK